MKKALVVGINFYQNISCLHGCVNDAEAVKKVLVKNSDESSNFEIKSLLGIDVSNLITRSELRRSIESLFQGDSETALLYFAGHGAVDIAGGYLITSDCVDGSDGVSLNEVLLMANKSRAKNKVIILDSCHSGIAGASALDTKYSTELAEGVTILSASTAEQYASEIDGSGVFTSLLVDALEGGAANLVGDVTPGSIYSHIDQSLGAWEQRPVFKTNVKNFVSLRKVNPGISISDLKKIITFFPRAGFEYRLDPTYEPELKGRDPGMPQPNPKNVEIFAVLQQYNRKNLLVPVGAAHMWNAAMESKVCKLTALGEHYRKLVEKRRI